MARRRLVTNACAVWLSQNHNGVNQEHVPVGLTALTMEWHDLLFAHWRMPVAAVQARLPRHLRVQVFDGSAWVAAVPFRMVALRPLGLPTCGLIPDFLELNLRTYVQGPDGRTGVWFFSLECNHPASVMAARLGFSLGYQHARLICDHLASGWFRFVGQREALVSSFHYRRVDEFALAQVGSFEYFIAERYRLFAHRRHPQLQLQGQVSHDPYQLAPAKAHVDADALFQLNGFDGPGRQPDHLVMAAPVRVRASVPTGYLTSFFRS